jgi:hypothetical protein
MKEKMLGLAVFVLLFWSAGSLVSCDDEVEPITIFELDVKSSYPSATSDNWVIATNMNGEPIAAAPFESGETVVLEGVPGGDLINITLMIYTPSATSTNDRDYYFFNSYKDVPVGNKWYLKRAPGIGSQNAGKVSVHITNLPGNNSDLSISSFNRRNEVTTAWNGPVLSLQVGLRKSPSDLFFSVIDATPRHLKIDAGAGQDLNFDYHTHFVPFDNLIPVGFNVSNLVTNIQGFNVPMGELPTTDINYHTQSIYTGNSAGIKVGYNNGYSFYQTSWTATFPIGRRVAYLKLGDAPSAASYDPRFNLDFTVVDNRITSTSFNASEEFDYCTNEYFVADELSENKPVTTWQIVRPALSLDAPLIRFPDEMIDKYPYLPSVVTVVNYQRSTFVHSIRDGAYDNYLDERFRSEEFKLFPKETFSLSK